MRATSDRRTVEPSGLARSTMAPNCSADVSWPLTTTCAEICWLPGLGRSPSVPDATCAFWLRIAVETSAVLSL
jgi:hypothetical protein